jgi:hypothetical protein
MIYETQKKEGRLLLRITARAAVEVLTVCFQNRNAGAGPKANNEFAMQLSLWFGQPEMNPQPLFAADHQPSLPQIAKVAGNRGLRQTERLMQVADAHLTVGQEIQKPQPYRIRERLEEFNRPVQRISRGLLYPHGRI